jgi:hypothetical protein
MTFIYEISMDRAEPGEVSRSPDPTKHFIYLYLVFKYKIV